jgi:hypothetical protein
MEPECPAPCRYNKPFQQRGVVLEQPYDEVVTDHEWSVRLEN